MSGKDRLEELPHIANSSPMHAHKRTSSDLSELSLIELERNDETEEVDINIVDNPEEQPRIPLSTLVVVTETEKLNESAVFADISDFDFTLEEGAFKVYDWDGKKFYSDFIKEGLEYQKRDLHVVMLFESPSTSTSESSFHNKTKFKFHDWPPPKSTMSKQILGPCRYASMNGASFPLFLRNGKPPAGLVEHWAKTIPGYVPSSYVDKIRDKEDTIYAYLPVEQIRNHLNNPESKCVWLICCSLLFADNHLSHSTYDPFLHIYSALSPGWKGHHPHDDAEGKHGLILQCTHLDISV